MFKALKTFDHEYQGLVEKKAKVTRFDADTHKMVEAEENTTVLGLARVKMAAGEQFAADKLPAAELAWLVAEGYLERVEEQEAPQTAAPLPPFIHLPEAP